MAPVIILGGLRTGAFTPTEAAVVAVAYGLIVGLLIYRTLSWHDIYRALVDSAQTSAVILIIMSLAGIFAWAGSTLGAFDEGAHLLFSLSDNGTVVLLLVMVVLLLAGMVLDGISIYLITLPLLIPLMDRFGWNPTWFGILMAMNIAIGQFTPPVAVNLMVTAKVGGREHRGDGALGDLVRGLDGDRDRPGDRLPRNRAVVAPPTRIHHGLSAGRLLTPSSAPFRVCARGVKHIPVR